VFLVYRMSYAAPFTLLEKVEFCCESDNRAVGQANLRTPALFLLDWPLEPWEDCSTAAGRRSRLKADGRDLA